MWSLFRSCTITTELVNGLFPFTLGVSRVQGRRRSKSGDGDVVVRVTCIYGEDGDWSVPFNDPFLYGIYLIF